MYLSTMVSQYINNEISKVYHNNGKEVKKEKLIKEYRQIKHYLLLNFKTNDVIGISLNKDYKYLLVILASIEIGLIYVPMNSNWPIDRIKKIEALASIYLTIDSQIVKNMLDNEKISNNNSFDIYEEKPLYIIFTSGSTGEPKGVVIKRESVENFFSFCDDYFQDINNTDNILQIADFSFDMSVLDLGIILTKQSNIYFSEFKGNVFRLAYEIEQYNISLISTVPNNINMLLSEGVVEKVNLKNLKNLFIGGARFSYGLYKKLLLQDINVYNFYGPTEATVYALVKKLVKDESLDVSDYNISIGTPLSNVKIELVNIVNGIGELYLGGIQVMSKYISNIEKTKEALVEINDVKYYKTGDLSFKDSKDEYYIVGRTDDTIKRRGYRVNLQDIDSYILTIDSVIECTTIAIPDEIHENIIVTYLYDKNNDTPYMKSKCMKILPEYQIPDKFIFIEEFPTNNSGKICKKTLKEMYLN